MTEQLDSRMAEMRELVNELAGSLPGRLSRLSVQAGDCSVQLEWAAPAVGGPPAADSSTHPAPAAHDLAGHDSAARGAGAQQLVLGASGSTTLSVESTFHQLGAPLVGTFYRGPEPGAPPFVSPGDLVSPGQQVGIVEAMKMLVSVTSDREGRVVDVLVADACPVEYAQPLILIDPLDLA